MLIQREQDQTLQRAVDDLTPRQLLILQFRFEHALSVREIGQIMRLEEREVRKLLDTSLELLRKSIEK